MTMHFSTSDRVPASAVERLRANLSGLIDCLAAALQMSDADEANSARAQRLLALLQQEEGALQEEAERFAAHDREPLLTRAAGLALLARRMDGFDLSFSGQDTANSLEQRRQLLVLVAWQIAAAARGYEAAGL